jgi:hypothetical protein
LTLIALAPRFSPSDFSLAAGGLAVWAGCHPLILA